MIEKLKEIEDRWLVLVLLVVFAGSFAATRDAVLADIIKILLGAFCTVILKRTDRQLIVTGDTPQTKSVVAEFASKQ